MYFPKKYAVLRFLGFFFTDCKTSDVASCGREKPKFLKHILFDIFEPNKMKYSRTREKLSIHTVTLLLSQT